MAYNAGHSAQASQHGQAPSKLEPVEEVLLFLRRIIRATDIHSKQLSKHSGLTSPQLLVLMAIRKLGDVNIGTIAREVNLSQATVTTILDRLEKRDMVHRVRSQLDRRRVHAKLTPAGTDVLEGAPSPLQESFVKKFNQLPRTEQNQILDSLQQLAHPMQAQDIDASPVLYVGDMNHNHYGNPGPTES